MIFPSHARAFLKSVFIIHQQQFYTFFLLLLLQLMLRFAAPIN